MNEFLNGHFCCGIHRTNRELISLFLIKLNCSTQTTTESIRGCVWCTPMMRAHTKNYYYYIYYDALPLCVHKPAARRHRRCRRRRLVVDAVVVVVSVVVVASVVVAGVGTQLVLALATHAQIMQLNAPETHRSRCTKHVST